MLSRVTRFSIAQISLLAFAGYGTLHANFLLGQYYVFLLFLLVLAFWSLSEKREFASGFLCGTAFALKLYGAPFALYFAAKQRWKPLAGMIAGSAILIAVSIGIFGWRDNLYFASQILPRALQGETLDPYNSGNGTISTLLRRTFVREPELNPHALWNAPWMFFFLQPLVVALILVFPLLLVARSRDDKHAFAWFFLAMVLASPNTASYTFIILLVPVTLLLEEADAIERIILISCYSLLSLPIGPVWSRFFPKVFLLSLMFILTGKRYWHILRARESLIVLALAMTIAVPFGWWRFDIYLREPPERWERIALRRGAIYSSSPAVLRSGIVYESIGKAHYVLRWFHEDRDEEFTFAGDAFHPIARSPDGPIQFELVARGLSTTILFDVLTRKLIRASPAFDASASPSSVSPDRKWSVFVASAGQSQQIWLRRTAGGQPTRLTGGSCNSFSPTWAVDSEAVLFASDCGRGIGLPALYRARLDQVKYLR